MQADWIRQKCRRALRDADSTVEAALVALAVNRRVVEDLGECANRVFEAIVPRMAEIEPDTVLEPVRS